MLDEDEAGLSSSYGAGRYDGDSGDAGKCGELCTDTGRDDATDIGRELLTDIGRDAGRDDAITDVTEDAGELILETG